MATEAYDRKDAQTGCWQQQVTSLETVARNSISWSDSLWSVMLIVSAIGGRGHKRRRVTLEKKQKNDKKRRKGKTSASDPPRLLQRTGGGEFGLSGLHFCQRLVNSKAAFAHFAHDHNQLFVGELDVAGIKGGCGRVERPRCGWARRNRTRGTKKRARTTAAPAAADGAGLLSSSVTGSSLLSAGNEVVLLWPVGDAWWAAEAG